MPDPINYVQVLSSSHPAAVASRLVDGVERADVQLVDD
jgi:hypothetical protein